uniref:Occludin/ELL domain containing 1 n=1 Tax=Lynx canadensis TaxID=61383 RepID=A0A667H505_LYNCA
MHTGTQAPLRERTQTRRPGRWDRQLADHPRHARAAASLARPARPPQGRPKRRLPEADAYPGEPQDPRLSGDLQTRPPGPGPPRLVPPVQETSPPRALCEPQPGAHRARPKKIVFEDELPSRALLGTRSLLKPSLGGLGQGPNPVPDYELKYPQVRSERERSRLCCSLPGPVHRVLGAQQEVGCARAKLRQLETLLNSLPRPRSQKEAQLAARVWREFKKKQTDPSFLDKQARCHYLKGKLRHLKIQIQKFDEQGDQKSSVYF